MENLAKKFNIEITTGTIIKILVFALALWLIYLIREVVAILFFALLLVSILEPLVDWLRSKKVPKLVAVLLIYLVIIALIALIVVLIIPPISDQVEQLAINFPQYWQKAINEISSLSTFLSSYGLSQTLKDSLISFKDTLPTGGIFEKIENFFSAIVSLVVVLVITFYLLVEENAAKKILKSILPLNALPYAYQLFNKIQKQLGLWLRGQLILCAIIFIMVYLALIILGVKYALILAIIAGIMEAIPYFGPAFSGLIAVALTFVYSPILALLVLILYLAIQFVENHFLVPNVMRQTVGLNPVISIISILIGVKLGGFVGVIIAIPLATVINVIVQEFFDKRKEKDLMLEEVETIN